MSHSKFNRRQFLRGAAGAIGFSVMGSLPARALAGALSSRSVTVGYWTGSVLVPAGKYSCGDTSLQSVRVTMQSYGTAAGLTAIQMLAPVPLDGTIVKTPFNAWIAPPRGNARTRFVAAAHPQEGLLFNVSQLSGGTEVSSQFALATATTAGPKLKEGTYVIIAGTVDLSMLRLGGPNATGPLVSLGLSSVPPQYVVMKIERA